ncbi:hypothetical protein AAVH_36471 [Aphelenchoides avenae]|nr:hypothetical protein AAVH_36471 [Aphelenchus avenae]
MRNILLSGFIVFAFAITNFVQPQDSHDGHGHQGDDCVTPCEKRIRGKDLPCNVYESNVEACTQIDFLDTAFGTIEKFNHSLYNISKHLTFYLNRHEDGVDDGPWNVAVGWDFNISVVRSAQSVSAESKMYFRLGQRDFFFWRH